MRNLRVANPPKFPQLFFGSFLKTGNDVFYCRIFRRHSISSVFGDPFTENLTREVICDVSVMSAWQSD